MTDRTLVALAVIASVLVAGCADDDFAENDALRPNDGAATHESGLSGPQIIYVDFDGADVSDCSNYCSDAPTNRSWAISAHFGVAEMKFAPYENAAGKLEIVDRLTATFAPYNVEITTSRPTEGPYTMVIISPTSAAHHGVAPLDCLNSNPNDIAFVYNLDSSAKWSTPAQISRSAAHELGHSFGLEHVVSHADIMQWASSGDAFTVSQYDQAHPSGHDCLAAATQDAPATLLESLGAAP